MERKTPKGETIHLHRNLIHLTTGDGLTPAQRKFFKEPRTMLEIWHDLFKGDAFAACRFQNKHINDNVLGMKYVPDPSYDGRVQKLVLYMIDWDQPIPSINGGFHA